MYIYTDRHALTSYSFVSPPVLAAGEGYVDNSLFNKTDTYIPDHFKKHNLNGNYSFQNKSHQNVFVSCC